MTELSRIEELRARLAKATTLYEGAESDGDKIRLLEMLGVLEEQIRMEEYKERLIAGEE